MLDSDFCDFASRFADSLTGTGIQNLLGKSYIELQAEQERAKKADSYLGEIEKSAVSEEDWLEDATVIKEKRGDVSEAE